VDFNYSAAPERYDQVGSAMGLELEKLGPENRKEALLKGILRLREDAGVKGTLGALGVTPKDIPQLSINAFNDPCLATNPRKASIQEIERLYEKAIGP
jgi:alcohol dehydrogenase